MSRPGPKNPRTTRREFLASLAAAPLLLRPSGFKGFALLPGATSQAAFPFDDHRYHPRYPSPSPLEDVLRLVPPGADDYTEEKYAVDIADALRRLAAALQASQLSAIPGLFTADLLASPLAPTRQAILRDDHGVKAVRNHFAPETRIAPVDFLQSLASWAGRDARILTAEFEIPHLETIAPEPLAVRAGIRYSIVAQHPTGQREQRSGSWLTEWVSRPSASPAERWQARLVRAQPETVSTVDGPAFHDVTHQALGAAESYQAQLLHGSDHWRSVLDAASGIDVYGNNGIAVGDFDQDGHDDLYVSQPAGLPNRLYRNRGDGTFEDVTEKAGVGVLDNTSCALFADLRNTGLQDLLVVCGSGPLLFLNQGDGTFALKRDAFQFARVPQGTFTHAAIADYDRDGRLDIYFCLYSYYLGLDQYHYPVPYFDARNGPPNFLLHNQGDGTFVDRTEASGLNVENNRYSFACAWNENSAANHPDLYVVNDFGRNNLYRNIGNGTFTLASTEAHVEDVGAGMSAAWGDVNNDGRPDLYVANMWSAAGQRVSQQPRFHRDAPEAIRALYQGHAEGNALYTAQPDGTFRNVSRQAGADVGRWAWGSDFWDFDHDGFSDLYVTNGYISAPASAESQPDLGSFFWRQVVAKSPNDSTPSLAYEHGWNALNELIRSNSSWSGFERNVMLANNRDGTFSEVSGAVGLDFLEDGRSFALVDLDHDGRLEVIVKNRNAPQLRILHNAMQQIGSSIAFRLRGTKSNRDGIGTAITVETAGLPQTKYLQAGSGFLAQHTKELFFGVGHPQSAIRATVRWPSGLVQHFDSVPKDSSIYLEEGAADFVAKPFASTPYRAAPSAPEQTAQEPRPDSIETWLIEPLPAPSFSLPDLEGKTQALQTYRGHPVLLCFWSPDAPSSRAQLSTFNRQRTALVASGLTVLGMTLNATPDSAAVRSILQSEAIRFPVLLVTDQVAGIYNIIYRYLFDRRRDLGIPTSFLLDATGAIVKVYQGQFAPERIAQDALAIPATAAERMRKALPFPGTLYQGDFQRNDYTYGVAMFQHGYLDQAEESFRQVVAAKPNDPEGFYNLGTLNLRKNNFPQARTYLQQTLKLKPDYPEAWNNLGMMAAQESHFDEAIQNFQQSLQLRPTYATALLNLGNVYRRRGEADKAKDALSRALALQPDDPEANYSLGMFYAQQGDLATSEKYLRTAIALRPQYAEALNNLGVLFVRQQDYTRAEQQFQACIRTVPGFDQAYINLARLYILLKQPEKAKQALRDLLQVHPENAAARQALSMLESTP